MKSIITVVGRNQVGIIANVCSLLAENDVNVLDIDQSIKNVADFKQRAENLINTYLKG